MNVLVFLGALIGALSGGWRGMLIGGAIGYLLARVLPPTVFAVVQQLGYSDMELVVAGSRESIVMVEGGALEVSEEDVVEALGVAHRGIGELIDMQEELLGKIERPAKMAWTKAAPPEGMAARVRDLAEGRIAEAINRTEKHTRMQAVAQVKREVGAPAP